VSIDKHIGHFKIGVVSLSNSLYRKDGSDILKQKVLSGINFLTKAGFTITVGKSVFNSCGYKASSIKERVEDLHQMFSNEKVNLIMNTVGGYNSNEILEYLDFAHIQKHPKIFVGFSDITTINLALYSKAQIETVNGAHLSYFVHHNNAFDALFDLLKNRHQSLTNPIYVWENEANATLRQPGEIKYLEGKKEAGVGSALGGNLSTFCLLLGTEYMPDLADTILFLEYDKEEATSLPSIERFLWQVRQNGIFKKIKALIFGHLPKEVAGEENENDNIHRILEQVTEGCDFPVLYNACFGHIYPSWQIINGTRYQVETHPQCLIKTI